MVFSLSALRRATREKGAEADSMQDDFYSICLASCKHLSGVTRWFGAPKWGIRRARLYSWLATMASIEVQARRVCRMGTSLGEVQEMEQSHIGNLASRAAAKG
jgi:hypothetical protein